ncbi:MAG: ribosome small subunit-dependent GTPase A [Chloroflexi bacterium RBG_16_64_43]|nr:MAG: ribosome small subunit-dependent GTPase A [Chloroflexi bacterium RBG_16_64_43]
MSTPTLHPGQIIKAQSGFFSVLWAGGMAICQLRGRLKQHRRATDLAAVGDRVLIDLAEDGSGQICQVLPRARVLSRRAPRADDRQASVEQVLVANPDQVLFVFACAQPAPHLRMLDRFLVAAERTNLPARICANKIDLVGPAAARALFDLYPPIGYEVLYTSAETGEGVAELRAALQGKLSVLSGPSGAGKTSLLNAVQPGLGLSVRRVSRATSKGRHTTVVPEILPLAQGGFVADTPGIRAMGLWDIEPEELDAYFPEIRPLVDQCQFNDCSHLSEPGCAVRRAAESGGIDPRRYDSYTRLRRGEH